MQKTIGQLLTEFEAISLDEMDDVKLMNRVDTKFAFSVQALLELLPALSANYRILEVEGTRTPFYESLYFDDANFTFFSEHHRNRGHRFKVRVRNYVESKLFFLEIKEKVKGRTLKKRIKIDGFPTALDATQSEYIHDLVDNAAQLKPVMWNSFHRLTLVNKLDKERLTLDFDLKFKWDETEYFLDKLVIAELKQENVHRDSAFYQLMKLNQIRAYRLSKYCLGMTELYGASQLKFNRFKKKLLHLKKINNHAA
ncbi:MAG: polyphosphate polymerase domain-containing protein [Bacteroidota bacterium]